MVDFFKVFFGCLLGIGTPKILAAVLITDAEDEDDDAVEEAPERLRLGITREEGDGIPPSMAFREP